MEQVRSILDFADGAITERIHHELLKVVENIQDPNTDEKPRKLKIELTLTPTNGGRSVAMKATVHKVLRPTSEVSTQMVFQKINDELRSFELTGIPDGQMDMFGGVHEQKFISIKTNNEEGANND